MAGRKIALVPLFFFFLSLTFFSRDEEKWMESLLSTLVFRYILQRVTGLPLSQA